MKLISAVVVALVLWALPLTANESIHSICKTQASRCLDEVPSYIAKSQPYSDAWYRYTLYQYDALFALQRFEPLMNSILAIDNLNTAPVGFQVSANIYLAKGYRVKNDFIQLSHYAKVARGLLKQVSKQFNDPSRLVQLGNLILYQGNVFREKNEPKLAEKTFNDSFQLLKNIEADYHHYTDPIFNRELYVNLGHVSHALKNLRDSEVYYGKSLFWTKQVPDQQQLAVAEFNYGRACERNNKIDCSLKFIAKSRVNFKQAKDFAGEQMAILQLARMYNAKGDTPNYLKFKNAIDFLTLPQSLHRMARTLP